LLQDETLVCLSSSPWDTGLPSACHYLMQEFARAGNRVLFVDRALSVKDLVVVEREADEWLRARIARTAGTVPRLRRVGELYALTPPPVLSIGMLPPGLIHDTVNRLNAALLRRCVSEALRDLGWHADIVWAGLDLPGANALAGRLGERLLVYHCFAEPPGLGCEARQGTRQESRLISRADVVFATSSALLRHKRSLAAEIGSGVVVAYLPDGVDHCRLARALAPDTPVPAALAGLPHPVAGYLGTIEDRLDFHLLETAAGALSEGTLVVAGPASGRQAERLRILATLPNVVILGPVDPAAAPGVLKAFDIGLVPFSKTVAASFAYPLEVNEYLAAGLPVVASDFADLGDMAPHVRVAASSQAFAAALRDAATPSGPGKRLERSRFAAGNSWRRRAEAASEVLQTMVK